MLKTFWNEQYACSLTNIELQLRLIPAKWWSIKNSSFKICGIFVFFWMIYKSALEWSVVCSDQRSLFIYFIKSKVLLIDDASSTDYMTTSLLFAAVLNVCFCLF